MTEINPHPEDSGTPGLHPRPGFSRTEASSRLSPGAEIVIYDRNLSLVLPRLILLADSYILIFIGRPAES